MQNGRRGSVGDPMAERAKALTEAAIKAGRNLGLKPTETAAVLGVPAGLFTQMEKGGRTVELETGEGERAEALVKVFIKLSHAFGHVEAKYRAWLRTDNPGLGDRPIVVMQQKYGVLKVATFLEDAKLT
jgi:uncharacterized protein (DUF2384 family)